MADALHFTGNEEADALLAEEPLALLIGFALDQQVPVQTAFLGPLKLKQRFGTLDARKLATADPGELEQIVSREAGDSPLPGLDGQAGAGARGGRSTTSTAGTPNECGRTRRTATTFAGASARFPGFGKMKVKRSARCSRSASASRPRRISYRTIRRSATSTRPRRSRTTRRRSGRTRLRCARNSRRRRVRTEPLPGVVVR